MLYILISTFILVGICVLLLGIKVFFSKKREFPKTHIGDNLYLKKKGIACAKAQDLEEQNKKNIFDLSNL